jgi:polysaccharide deacetylase 2 family uncharacterized protein YibQ
MPKRRSSSAKQKRRAPVKLLGALAGIALTVFLVGELSAFLRSDYGRVLIYRYAHLGNRAGIVRIVGKRIHEGLANARVPRAAVREEVVALAGGGTPRWHVELPESGAPTLVNYEVTTAVQHGGAMVLSGRETGGAGGAQEVTLVVGFPGRPLQELVVTRPGRQRREDAARKPVASIAVVLYGLGENSALAKRVVARREPFAVAVPAAGDGHVALRNAVRAAGHELVLQVPMEPEKYPSVSPGPGTLLVTMSPRRIQKELHDALEEAGAVTAVANLMGSLATQDEAFMTAFYRELRSANVTFLHIQPVPRAVCRPLAARLGTAYDEPDVTLDAETRMQKPLALARAWREALARAERRGHAIVLVRVTPLSAKWLDEALSAKGLGGATLVPLSSIIHRPGAE